MIRHILKQLLGPAGGPKARDLLHRTGRHVQRLKEHVLGGGRLREWLLLRLLKQHYSSKFRRDWLLGGDPPHFFDHRIGICQFAYGKECIGPYPYYRGFYSSELLRDGDRLLDIGCGDGFFSQRFFSQRCAQIDAIDIEPSAIQAAVANHAAANIRYYERDAVAQPFPQESYDVIVWDGALGHFAPDTTGLMLQKISRALARGGVFAGSESLGQEGSDHLQFFASLEDLAQAFRPHFQHVLLRSTSYRLSSGTLRQEAYWRCANDSQRLRECSWRSFEPMAEGMAA